MDKLVIKMVERYAREHLPRDSDEAFRTFIVWKCKTLQNWKYLISTTIPDGMYYEITYNGDKKEWYFDAYKKVENHAYTESDVETLM